MTANEFKLRYRNHTKLPFVTENTLMKPNTIYVRLGIKREKLQFYTTGMVHYEESCRRV